jgi:hypothetical protein
MHSVCPQLCVCGSAAFDIPLIGRERHDLTLPAVPKGILRTEVFQGLSEEPNAIRRVVFDASIIFDPGLCIQE